MLVKYKRSCEKIAMGMLGLMPNEQKVKKLQTLIRLYEDKPERQLYLWKEDDDHVGLLGVEFEGEQVMVRHIIVTPSHRGEGLGQTMVNQLKQQMEPRKVELTAEAEELFSAAC